LKSILELSFDDVEVHVFDGGNAEVFESGRQFLHDPVVDVFAVAALESDELERAHRSREVVESPARVKHSLNKKTIKTGKMSVSVTWYTTGSKRRSSEKRCCAPSR
jgi:hypothetical protein